MFSNSKSTMKVLYTAIATNNTGTKLLAVGQADKAFKCFRQALRLFSSVNAGTSNVAMEEEFHGLNPIVVVEHSRKNNATAKAANLTANEALWIESDSLVTQIQETGLTAEKVSLCCIAAVFNCAVSVERLSVQENGGGRDEESYKKACRLYDNCWVLLEKTVHAFDCDYIADRIIYRLAANYHGLGDWRSAQVLLEDLYQDKLCVLVNDPETSCCHGGLTAPMA